MFRILLYIIFSPFILIYYIIELFRRSPQEERKVITQKEYNDRIEKEREKNNNIRFLLNRYEEIKNEIDKIETSEILEYLIEFEKLDEIINELQKYNESPMSEATYREYKNYRIITKVQKKFNRISGEKNKIEKIKSLIGELETCKKRYPQYSSIFDSQIEMLNNNLERMTNQESYNSFLFLCKLYFYIFKKSYIYYIMYIEQKGDNMILYIVICVIFIINLFIYISVNQKEDKIEYYRDIPSNESPAIIGLIIKENVDGNDIVATLLDLNSRGFIDINYDINNRSILRLTDKERFMVLKDYENYLLDQIFTDTNEVVFDDFVASDKFKQVFRTVGDMIKKRVDIASVHKLSHKKNYSKINFLTSYILFSFSLVFPILYIFFKDNIVIPLIISYGISYIFISLYKMIIDDSKHKLDNIILASSITISVAVFSIFVVLHLVNNFNFELNNITGQLTVSVPVTTGYVTGGTVTGGYYLSVVLFAQRTITPSTQDQVISGEQYIPIGGITVEGDADLVASNILSTANIFGVQGSVNLRTYYTGTAAPAAALGNNGDIYFQTAN